jgi:hypothetical protein
MFTGGPNDTTPWIETTYTHKTPTEQLEVDWSSRLKGQNILMHHVTSGGYELRSVFPTHQLDEHTRHSIRKVKIIV